MRVRRLWIQNFPGVKSLDWKIPADQRLVALVGPGDSGKSTILEAVHYLLGDRWNIPFSDTDFHGADVSSPISILALAIDLPAALRKDTALGSHCLGSMRAGTCTKTLRTASRQLSWSGSPSTRPSSPGGQCYEQTEQSST